MFLTRIDASEIISHVKPEFAKYAKKVKYKPVESVESIYIPERLSPRDRYLLKYQCVSRMNNGVDSQILAAQGAIESYAKHNNVTIDLDRRISVIDGKTPEIKDHIAVSVYNPKTKAHTFEFVPVFDENQTVKTVKASQRMIDIPSDGTQVVRPTVSEYEDNFIRHLYRKIESAVKASAIR